MEKRRLGKTDLEITPVGLGCWQFSQGANMMAQFWDIVSNDTITAVAEEALKGGINWFDTAEAYGNGKSEQNLSAALARLKVKPGSVTIATKWWPVGRTASSIAKTIDTRVSNLGPYGIDLYQIHQPWSFSPVAAQMREMAKLLRARKIRAIGVSNFGAKRMQLAHDALAAEGIVLASNQMRFNLLDRSIERKGVLDAAKRLGITIIAYSPLAQGVLSGRFHEDPSQRSKISRGRRILGGLSDARLARTAPLVEELRLIARAHGVKPGQVALAWAVSFHGDTVVAIPGATKPGQAAESAAAMAVKLSEKERTRLDELSRQAGSR